MKAIRQITDPLVTEQERSRVLPMVVWLTGRGGWIQTQAVPAQSSPQTGRSINQCIYLSCSPPSATDIVSPSS